MRAVHPELGEWLLHADDSAQLLFCENETNNERLFGAPNASPYVKDGSTTSSSRADADAVNPAHTGTKVGRPPRADAGAGRERVASGCG